MDNDMMLLPQEYLRHDSLESLRDQYAIDYKRHPKWPNLIQLRYNQIASPLHEPIVQQCRGLILDEADDWAVVARPFDKFFNYGETAAATIDWATASVQEKLDGSLMILYWYQGQWQVASSGTPDAGGRVGSSSTTFAELFWSVYKEKRYILPPEPCRWTTYCFELMTPYNRVVVRHRKNDLRLVGCRSNVDGRGYATKHSLMFQPVKEYDIATFEDVLRTFDTMDPLQQEGYVIVDAKLNRIKVKHPGYVAIHHLKDGFGPRRIVDVIRRGESSELLTHFPEWKPAFEQIQRAYDDFINHVTVEYGRLKHIPIQKDFALEALKTRCPSALFEMRKGTGLKDIMEEMHLDRVVGLLGVGGIELAAMEEKV